MYHHTAALHHRSLPSPTSAPTGLIRSMIKLRDASVEPFKLFDVMHARGHHSGCGTYAKWPLRTARTVNALHKVAKLAQSQSHCDTRKSRAKAREHPRAGPYAWRTTSSGRLISKSPESKLPSYRSRQTPRQAWHAKTQAANPGKGKYGPLRYTFTLHLSTTQPMRSKAIRARAEDASKWNALGLCWWTAQPMKAPHTGSLYLGLPHYYGIVSK